MKKRITAVLLTCVLAVGLAAGPVGTSEVRAESWLEQTTEDGFVYQEGNGGIIITRYDNTNVRELVIPESIDGKKVTEIGAGAFAILGNLTSVRIPEGVMGIGKSAFSVCASLADIQIPGSVKHIGDGAFDGTPWLKKQFEQNGGLAIVNQILISADNNLSGSVTIPEGVTAIIGDAFHWCGSLTNVSIPDSVTSIGAYAFFECSSLTNVSIPDSVTSIGDFAFKGTPWLDEQLEQNEELFIVNQILISADNSYSDSIEVPEGVTAIGSDAFSGCSSLKSIQIPGSVKDIGACAFMECSSLKSIQIPDGVKDIGDRAFSGCSSLKSIQIPGSVKDIGTGAFSGCSSLESIQVSNGVTIIGHQAFSGCSSLKSIQIPSSAMGIGEGAFSGCSNLTDVSIPESVKYINGSAFENTPWLAEKFRQNGGLAIVNQTVIDADETISGNIAIPAGVTKIGEGAFRGCKSLTGIRMPGGVTEIGVSAFYECSSLASVSIPTGVKVIRRYAFEGCKSLTSIRIPAGVTEIGVCAFGGCEKLTAIRIPVSLKKLGGAWGFTAFDANVKVKDVYYGGGPEQWKRIWFGAYNVALASATFHYYSDGPADLDVGTPQKTVQIITANDITKTYGAKAFLIGAKSSGGTALSYAVSNPKVATVDGNGEASVKGCGITDITITAAETNEYSKAQKTIRLTVKPKKVTVSSVKSKKRKTATVRWKKDKNVSGYLIECAADKKFKKNKVKTEVKKNKTVTATLKKLKPGKKYYVRICAYATSGNVKVKGDWSKTKTVKVKK